MKTIIFCGGEGMRLREYTDKIPKPLVEIGGKPILWHIMKYYVYYGFNDFILCLGYKKEKIIEYFKGNKEFNIKFVDTGLKSSKGERLRQVKNYIISQGENFWVAYGDDLADINLLDLLKFHKQNKKIVTLTTVQAISQFGVLDFDGPIVTKFTEKPVLDYWINGGFYIMNKKIFDYLKSGWDLEKEAFEKLVEEREICAFKHKGFWKCVNTFKDTLELNELWNDNKAVWKVWE